MHTPDAPQVLTDEQANAILQAAANKLTAAIRQKIDKDKQIDFVENEIVTKLAFIHLQVLTKMLCEKGLIDEGSFRTALTNAFASEALEMVKPKIALPKH